jgi:hypothetical protein
METPQPQAGQSRLRVSDHRVTAAHLWPATPVDVQRQEPARLRGGRIKITVVGQHHVRRIAGLGHPCLGAAPVTFGTKHRAQPWPGRLGERSPLDLRVTHRDAQIEVGEATDLWSDFATGLPKVTARRRGIAGDAPGRERLPKQARPDALYACADVLRGTRVGVLISGFMAVRPAVNAGIM